MLSRLLGRRGRRRGLTAVEYALMLFFFAMTAVFGFPTLAKTAARCVASSAAGFDTVSNAH